MSTKSHPGGHGEERPVHSDVTFEERDIHIATISRYLLYLAITIVVALAVCVPILKVLTAMSVENDTPVPPVRAAMSDEERQREALPAEPRLQGVPGHMNDPQRDLREKIQADTEANERFGWLDKEKGIAQIPVSAAMEIIAEKSEAGAAAPAGEKKR
jgi:hypothetical protein